MSEIVFNVYRDEDGGYYTHAVDKAIVTQGDTWDELRANIQEAIAAYYLGEEHLKPTKIKLQLVEELLVA